jgi:hypothetical protein
MSSSTKHEDLTPSMSRDRTRTRRVVAVHCKRGIAVLTVQEAKELDDDLLMLEPEFNEVFSSSHPIGDGLHWTPEGESKHSLRWVQSVIATNHHKRVRIQVGDDIQMKWFNYPTNAYARVQRIALLSVCHDGDSLPQLSLWIFPQWFLTQDEFAHGALEKLLFKEYYPLGLRCGGIPHHGGG